MNEECLNKIQQFCFVCSLLTKKEYKIKIDIDIIKLYKQCFGTSMRNLESQYSPDYICKICHTMMSRFVYDSLSRPMKSPAVWRDPRKHHIECFCKTETFGFRHSQRKKVKYNYGHSCTAPVFYKDEERSLAPVEVNHTTTSVDESPLTSTPKSSPQKIRRSERLKSLRPQASPSKISFDINHIMDDFTYDTDQQDENLTQITSTTNRTVITSPTNQSLFNKYDDTFCTHLSNGPKLLSQEELNDFIRFFDRRGGKKAAAGTGKFLHDHGFLRRGVNWTSYLNRETDLIDYFGEMDDGTPYCKEVKELIEDWFCYEYVSTDYRLFLDSGKGSFKCVLLHNDNLIGGIPLLYSTEMNENQDHVEAALITIGYYNECNQWLVVCDMKMVGVLLGEFAIECNLRHMYANA